PLSVEKSCRKKREMAVRDVSQDGFFEVPRRLFLRVSSRWFEMRGRCRMIVKKFNLEAFVSILRHSDESALREYDKVLICVSDLNVEFVGFHLLPPVNKMSLFFCESWPGKDYVDFLNLVAESKSIIKGIEMGLKRSKLSLRNYGRDALNV